MNLRQYKKKAKRARDLLISEYGFRESSFHYIRPRDRDEYSICVSEPMDAHLLDFGHSIYPLRGTPFHLPEPVDYYGEANDPRCCIDMLYHVIFWEACGNSIGRRSAREDAA